MSESPSNPLEMVLVAIARSAPEPWYYQQAARHSGVDPEALEDLLELLWLEGLICREGPSSSETGPGVTLTAFGQQVLADPETRERLRQGLPLRADQGAVVRDSLRRPRPAMVTRLLLVANFAVFGYCLWLARGNQDLLTSYLSMRITLPVVERVMHPAGAVTGIDVIRGEWWRLLTTCFVHAGILHLAFNMYTLYAAGRFVEQTWGHWRYLLIYGLSGWTGACLGLAYSPLLVVGASGALCGVLATDGVWIYLNGRHLPRSLAQRGRTQFWTTVVLMVFISLLPGVSAWGHLGGAGAGALTALILHFQRFGPRIVRVLGLLALIPIPWFAYGYLQEMRGKSELWREAEFLEFSQGPLPVIQRTMRAAIAAYQEVKEIRDKHPERREPEQVEQATARLQEQLSALRELAQMLQRAGPYRNATVENAREKALEYTRTRIEVFQEAERCLREGNNWKNADEKRYDELWEQLREKRQAWEELLER